MNPTIHLTDEQIYDLLDPAANTAAQTHLQTCGQCQAEIANLRASLANFRSAAISLAAMTAPNLPRVAAPIQSWFCGSKVWAASFAAATAVLALSISVLHPLHHTTEANPTSGSASKAAFSTESDDALLDSIQLDLSTSIPPSLEPLSVPAASAETPTQN